MIITCEKYGVINTFIGYDNQTFHGINEISNKHT